MDKNYINYEEQRDSLEGITFIKEWECGCEQVITPSRKKETLCPKHRAIPQINRKFRWFRDTPPFQTPHYFDTYEMRRLRKLLPDALEGDGNLIEAAISAEIKINHLGKVKSLI
jgi:hypothetical protein